MMGLLWRFLYWLRRRRGGQYVTLRAEHLTQTEDWRRISLGE